MQREITSGAIFRKLADDDTGRPLDETALQMSVRLREKQYEVCADGRTFGECTGVGEAGLIDRELRVSRDVKVFWRALEKLHERADTGVGFVFFACIAFLGTWLPHLGNAGAWEAIFCRDGYQCTSPVCFRRLILGPHHLRRRAHGGTDDPANLTSPCDFCHLIGEHLGRLKIRGRAPDNLTWILGVDPVMIVRVRDKELVA